MIPEVHPGRTGAHTWRYKLPCGHRNWKRQTSIPRGEEGAYACTNGECLQRSPHLVDLKTEEVAYP